MNITEARYKKLVKAYNKAVKEEKSSFMFFGNELLTSYAKYLIEYLSSHFNYK